MPKKEGEKIEEVRTLSPIFKKDWSLASDLKSIRYRTEDINESLLKLNNEDYHLTLSVTYRSGSSTERLTIDNVLNIEFVSMNVNVRADIQSIIDDKDS